jgi:xanthine dehydrogenase accessory factor
MSDSLIELAYQLTHAGKPFVWATVVWCERPTSAKPGAQAIVQEDGQLIGWVGGSCTQPIVLREARRLLRTGGEPFLLRLGTSAPDPTRQETGQVRVFPMTCASGGALDIYMELHLPQPHLLLIGDSPIIAALLQLAPVLDFAVSQIDDLNLDQAHSDERTCIILATHGQNDEHVLEHILAAPAAYIGMVSSPRRAEACRTYLRASGMAEEQITRLKAPAGLDIGARTPAEIAASILAELVQHRHAGRPASDTERSAPAIPAAAEIGEAIDPVCGMTVEKAGARHTSVYTGRTFYFCCPACKNEFEHEPARFLVKSE